MKQRYLTKSKYKLALECPNKLFYSGKHKYSSNEYEDDFLMALADGGFQVGALAKLSYPTGIEIEGFEGRYDDLIAKTNFHLQKENVVLFEAAFMFENLFIRTDILVKKGDRIELIEVKAKSFDPQDEFLLVGKKGKLVAGWKSYLFDVAFQKYVIQKVYPHWNIKSFLMMADKSKNAKKDGLNQHFRISKKDNRSIVISNINHIDEIGETVLGIKNIDEIIEKILNNEYKYGNETNFSDHIKLLSDSYQNDQYFGAEVSYNGCKKCEFKVASQEEAAGKVSGYKECWKKQKNWSQEDFGKPTIFEIWDFRKGNKMFEQGKYLMEDITDDDIPIKCENNKMSKTERQWAQIEKALQKDSSIYVETSMLKSELDSWVYPLNFIDFETSTVALPFNKGRRPYEQIAFQFSHHILTEDGKIEHKSEYIHRRQNEFPNFDFVRALKVELEQNNGSVFRYSHHENTILVTIYYQLEESEEEDKVELQQFIRKITHSKKADTDTWKGERDMIDLCDVVKRYYYNPHTKGSNSIKKVLPAVLSSSELLKSKYSKSIGELGISSRNFESNHIWLEIENGEVTNPYKLLKPIFQDWTEESLKKTISDVTDISDGGAALTAYAKLQYSDMSTDEKNTLINSLLRYCELDTLAMVMIYEHFRELVINT